MSNLKANDVYKEMLAEMNKKRDITSSTYKVIDKAHPKSPMVLGYEEELFGLSPEDIKKLPLKSVEALHSALRHLIKRTQDDPMLRQALRKMINFQFKTAEEELANEENRDPAVDDLPESLETYADYLSTLSEAMKAQKFNYKRLLDLDEKKIMDPAFLAILNTFQLNELLTRPQKQGVLLFLKKLAELADTNPMIAQALTKLIRIENTTNEVPAAPAEGMKESVDDDGLAVLTEAYEVLLEGIADSEVSPSSLLLTFGIGTADTAKKDAFAAMVFKYDAKFMEKNADKTITWKTMEAAFAHNKAYLQKLFKYITQDEGQKKIFAKKVAEITGKGEERAMTAL
jgi:hypothetical protein